MKTATQIAEEAIFRDEIKDADEAANGAGGAADDSKKKDAEAGAGAAANDDGDKNGGDANKDAGAADNDGGKGTDGKDADEGTFTADDALEVETPEAPKADAPKDAAGIQISQDEGKYIADNIGDPLIIRGVQGEGDNAKTVELKVYSPNDIPKDFKFGSDADLVSAQNGFQTLERKAQQLLGNYRDQQTTKQAQDFEQRENQGIRDDLADLQKAGDFPKFKVKPGDPNFEADPAAKQMADVLKLMSERNEQYLKEYQQGRPYRHIGFREAHELYQSKQTTAKRDSAQADEDKARKGVADKVATGKGAAGTAAQKPAIPRGTTIDQILAKHDAEEW
jgi:hypothetical protein